ncbi:MAG: hypothetical protein GWM88_10910 [Pseudomonadales bacterium]|nr:hypothetical protein [Pseudomonadales bacterium]NIX08479.1 hypothetical protein [Pseudomonadales bacterium]
MKGVAEFAGGVAAGVALAVVALGVAGAGVGSDVAPVGHWLQLNLGHSAWLFALVLTLYAANLLRLSRLLAGGPDLKVVVKLDQLSDVWINLFVGIGVIWTAVGMRSALQAALGDPGGALSDSAGSVLHKLVDGGILLALTTTIVGGVGGYLMRLVKTMVVGARLQTFYAGVSRADLRELVGLGERIEARLARLEPQMPGASA